MFNDKATETVAIGEGGGDSTIAQTINDVKDKAKGVTLNKDGTPRKRKGMPRVSDGGTPGTPPAMGQPGFTEAQVAATFKGLFSVGALSTNCNVWFLTDDEANCFVPSSTVALNQTFPSVAQSKWGAISLASLSFTAVFLAKLLVYLQFKEAQKKPIAPITPEVVA